MAQPEGLPDAAEVFALLYLDFTHSVPRACNMTQDVDIRREMLFVLS